MAKTKQNICPPFKNSAYPRDNRRTPIPILLFSAPSSDFEDRRAIEPRPVCYCRGRYPRLGLSLGARLPDRDRERIHYPYASGRPRAAPPQLSLHTVNTLPPHRVHATG